MKRELAAAALLLCLFGAARLNIAHADKLIDLLSLNLVRSENAARIGEYTTALTDLDNALSLWEKSRNYTDFFLRHPDLDTTADAFYDLRTALLQKDADALPAAFSKLRYHLQCIDYMEHLSLGTVF